MSIPIPPGAAHCGPVITPEIAAHVLQHIGAAEEPAGRPDLFTQWLITDLVDDPDATMGRITAYALAAHQAATEDGVQRLQEIALAAQMHSSAPTPPAYPL